MVCPIYYGVGFKDVYFFLLARLYIYLFYFIENLYLYLIFLLIILGFTLVAFYMYLYNCIQIFYKLIVSVSCKTPNQVADNFAICPLLIRLNPLWAYFAFFIYKLMQYWIANRYMLSVD